MAKKISFEEFMDQCEKGLISDIVYGGEPVKRIFGRSHKGTADTSKQSTVVWASVVKSP